MATTLVRGMLSMEAETIGKEKSLVIYLQREEGTRIFVTKLTAADKNLENEKWEGKIKEGSNIEGKYIWRF